MMSTIRLFRVKGIDVFLHWSWFLVAAFEITNRQNVYDSALWNVLEYLAIFLMVLLHEFGHALACRQVGGEAKRILLWPLGGVASVNPPQRPGAMLWTIAAGPLVNLVLAVILLAAYIADNSLSLSETAPNVREFFKALFVTNLVLLVFNLLPVYPLDGGQILRSLLWFVIGRAKSLMAASTIGFVGVAGIAAIAIWARDGYFALMGAFIAINCWNGWRAARALMRLEKAPRHESYRCPKCQARPLHAKAWRCAKCNALFDTFETHAACPACGAQFESTTCIDCGAASPFIAWAAAPERNGPTMSAFDPSNIKPLAEPLYKQRVWLKLVAILTIIGGVLTALTVLGVVIAWIPIWAGVALYQAASNLEDAMVNRQGDTLIRALSKLGLYFKINAVTWVLALGLVPVMIASALLLPRLLRYSEPKNEAMALAKIHKINTAQSTYMSSHQRYGTLRELVDGGLVERSLLGPTEGYGFRVETQESNYVILATALAAGGRYDYYSFADGVVRYSSDSRKAPPESSGAPAQ
jgi:Zn-dependent protease